MAYFRSGGLNLPPVIKTLIIINVIVWLAQISMKDLHITEWGALHYWRSPLFKPHQVISHMFMHDDNGPMHLLFNMLVLWMFGSILENFWGAKRFLNFYLFCGIGAALVQMAMVPFEITQGLKAINPGAPVEALEPYIQ